MNWDEQRWSIGLTILLLDRKIAYPIVVIYCDDGMWPSGKAPRSGRGDRRFESYHPSHEMRLAYANLFSCLWLVDWVLWMGSEAAIFAWFGHQARSQKLASRTREVCTMSSCRPSQTQHQTTKTRFHDRVLSSLEVIPVRILFDRKPPWKLDSNLKTGFLDHDLAPITMH